MELGRDMGPGQGSATDGGEPGGHEQPATLAPEIGSRSGEPGGREHGAVGLPEQGMTGGEPSAAAPENGTGAREHTAERQPATVPQTAPSPADAAGGQTAGPAPTTLSALLAGLQAGMVGVLIMLAWLGVSAAWQQRSFWTAENLMASVFYGSQSIHSGFAGRTLPGLALYVVLYSALGAVVALLLRNRLTRLRTELVCIVLAMVWYYVSFRWMWQHVMPLVALLHAERPTAIGHLLYGLWLGRFPAYLAKAPLGR